MTNSYPTLSARSADEIGQHIERIRHETGIYAGFDDAPFLKHVKTKPCKTVFNESALKAILADFQTTRSDIQHTTSNLKAKQNEQEEEFAALARRILRELPTEALQDPDFWRYLSVFKLRDYICAIEGDFGPGRFGGKGNRGVVRWTLVRGFVWGLHATSEDDLTGIYKARLIREELGLGSGVRDFYISHVVRPYWAMALGAGKAFIDAAMAEPPLFDRGKEFRPSQTLGARVARVSANIYLPSLSEEEIRGVILEQRAGIPHEPPRKDLEAGTESSALD